MEKILSRRKTNGDTTMRIHWQPREKTSILKLRKQGYSINALSTFFGRSASLIHKMLKFNELLSAIPRKDERKLPNQTRLKTAQRIRTQMNYWITRWLPFVLGETDKPP